ncbi:MAG: L-threonylcarbamoyladenylate synthase [Candidatus Neomarinimicrobiota bacterium]|jgi:L-threonylcarbamoyladenylate synthase|nr:L-threonylcarbamoyladenylate synthase [Candidatus Neomarinimicrobiota bacterium]MDD3965842.1 L-threonylcarbamoyladenylate synthase [Candidatus Neomarinimicrobiota bacterium]MDX9779988.1 L-threonylcarbamoyladenylate synthase [bacterium]
MILPYQHKEAVPRALHILQNGGVFVYPTDTLYGFGADAGSGSGIRLIGKLKKRPSRTPFSLLVRDLTMMKDYARVSGLVAAIAGRFLPGALTLVLPGNAGALPDELYSEGQFLGFRISAHPFCRELTAKYPKPVLSTSVNISGKDALNRIEDIQAQFGRQLTLMIEDAELDRRQQARGSTVIRIDANDSISLLREGSISFTEILKVKP